MSCDGRMSLDIIHGNETVGYNCHGKVRWQHDETGENRETDSDGVG